MAGGRGLFNVAAGHLSGYICRHVPQRDRRECRLQFEGTLGNHHGLVAVPAYRLSSRTAPCKNALTATHRSHSDGKCHPSGHSFQPNNCNGRPGLGKELLQRLPFICHGERAPIGRMNHFLKRQSQGVGNGRIEIRDSYRIGKDFPALWIGLSPGGASLHPSPASRQLNALG